MVFVGYIRVSTKQQGNSGLGLEAQQEILAAYARRVGGKLVAVFVEVESGKRSDRPELHKAIALANSQRATLLVAKLDRLSRNLRFLAGLMESKVAFKCCDMPECDNFTIHIFAALAQKEAELTSARTKDALAMKKARGEKLGKPENLKPEHRLKGAQATREKAVNNENNWRATEYIKTLRSSGLSLWQIAHRLNTGRFTTSTGKQFTAKSVQLLCKRAGL